MNLLWRMSLRNLLRNRRRSVTTGIAIAAGFIGLSLLGAYIIRAKGGLEANTIYLNLQGHLQIHKKDSLKRFSLAPKKYLITPELDAELDQILQSFSNEVEFQGHFLSGSGLLVSDKISQPFLAQGFEREIQDRAARHENVVRWAKTWANVGAENFSIEAIRNTNLISITPRLAEILGRPRSLQNLSDEQKNVQLVTRTFQNDLNAVNAELGLVHTTGVAMAEDSSVRLPLALLQELLATDGYQYRVLFLRNGAHAWSLKNKIQKEFQNRSLPLEIFHFTEGPAAEFYVGTMNFLYVMSAFFVFLICGMVALSIVNSLTLGILERTKELGTLKALGFSSEQVVGLFVRETVWLSLFSLFFGLIISQIVARLVNAANLRFTPPGIEGDLQFQLAPEVWMYVGLAVMLFAIAGSTAYYVSKRKLKASAIDLLSESGV